MGKVMFEKEKYNLELKEIVTDKFLKTVSAYANYNEGQIVFGVSDDGKVKGIENLRKDILRIEHMVNSTIEPRPNFEIKVKEISGKNIIILSVYKGKDTPYYYKGKSYKRSDTLTVEVDRIELNRLAMEGVNLNYEEKKSDKQDLEFKVLESKLKKVIGIDQLNLDILRTLNLYTNEGYFNIAAALLADENNYNFSAIDIVKFGKTINQILYRKTITNKSILTLYDEAIKVFEIYYQFEEIQGYERITKELIPKEAFREAIANALVHRQWDIMGNIQVSMYDNVIEITSPGGLPNGLTEEYYLYEHVSLLRNPIIASVFFRLKYIEQFGTGIKRIMEQYQHSLSKPTFSITENYIKLSLPLYSDQKKNLDSDEFAIYQLLKKNDGASREEIQISTKFNKSKVLRILNKLIAGGFVEKSGAGSQVTYILK